MGAVVMQRRQDHAILRNAAEEGGRLVGGQSRRLRRAMPRLARAAAVVANKLCRNNSAIVASPSCRGGTWTAANRVQRRSRVCEVALPLEPRERNLRE
jgi:hypothetical protein